MSVLRGLFRFFFNRHIFQRPSTKGAKTGKLLQQINALRTKPSKQQQGTCRKYKYSNREVANKAKTPKNEIYKTLPRYGTISIKPAQQLKEPKQQTPKADPKKAVPFFLS